MNYAETYPDEMTDYELFVCLDPAEIQSYQEILENDSDESRKPPSIYWRKTTEADVTAEDRRDAERILDRLGNKPIPRPQSHKKSPLYRGY